MVINQKGNFYSTCVRW